MSIVNYYDAMPRKYRDKNSQYKNYPAIRISIPNRILIVGSSGSGKSNILLNLIIGMNCFTKIWFIVKSPDEPLYKFFISEIREIEKKLKISMLTVSSEIDEIPHIDEIDKDETNLFVFDDVISEKTTRLKNISDFWIRGRKQNITTIFLSQSFYKTPHIIRQNTDVIIFKKIGTRRDLKMILSDYSLDKSVEELMQMYKRCNTGDINNFFMIDLKTNKTEDKFRMNFDPFPLNELKD